jgi:hypothetical protein
MERVLVAGTGVAAVETVLALRASSVTTPFGAAAATRIDLSALARHDDRRPRRRDR